MNGYHLHPETRLDGYRFTRQSELRDLEHRRALRDDQERQRAARDEERRARPRRPGYPRFRLAGAWATYMLSSV